MQSPRVAHPKSQAGGTFAAFAIVFTLLFTGALTTPLQAASSGIALDAPTMNLPASYVLASDPTRSNLTVEVSTVLNRNRLCLTLGGLFAPCPPVPTSVRITVGIGTGGRPLWTAQTTVQHTVPGVASIPIQETLQIQPGPPFNDAQEYIITVTLAHVEDPATETFVHDSTTSFSPFRIGYFSGQIRFGEVEGTISSLAAEPVYLGDSRWAFQVDEVITTSGNAAHSVASPPPLRADRSENGLLTVFSGELEASGPAPFEWSGWSGQRGRVLLGPEGWVTDALTLTLPPGVGWRAQNERRLRSLFEITAARIPLNADWQPVGPLSGSPATPIQIFADTYPVEFQSTTWTWGDGELTFDTPATRFVRALHYSEFQASLGNGDLPESNDSYWFHLRPQADSPLVIRPGRTGGISVDLGFQGGEFFGHFPLCGVRTLSGGSLRIHNNLIVPEDSSLQDATLHVIYGQGCRGPDQTGALPLPARALGLAGVTLEFTPAGGLRAEGELTSTAEDAAVDQHLEIGRTGIQATHQTDPFNIGRFYLPGTWVPHGDGFDHPGDPDEIVDQPGEDPIAFNPARYLLSGLRTNGTHVLEHPGTPAYTAGAGDYAGMNLRYEPGLSAISRVGGGETPTYPLATNAKYYARLSGVSGIHESADGPQELPAYGYEMNLTQFGLSFLDNTPHDSRVDGALLFPSPSGFSQAFERLLMTCCGNLSEGAIDPSDTQKQLTYWSATRFVSHSLRFTHDPDDPCATNQALVELGITADVGHLDEQPAGFLYPRPDGSLVAHDALGRESHLALSSLVGLAGYPFSAVRRAYFNDHAAVPGGPGWLNIAGNLGVSFFRDLNIHGHILGSSSTPPPPLFLKGGWSADGENFFSQAGFDQQHRGYPPSATVDNYRSETAFLPHAQQVWFGTVPFDYPVRFDSLTRSFQSPAPEELDLVVLGSASRLERLNAELADLRFSAFLDLTLLSAPDLLVEAGASWVTEHLEETALGSIREGLQRLSRILDVQMRELLDEVVLPAVEETVVAPLAAEVVLQPNAAAIDAALNDLFSNPFTDALSNLADVAGTGVNLTEQASSALERASATLQTVRQVLATLQQAEALIDAALGIAGFEVPAELRQEILNELEQAVGPNAVGRLVEIRAAIQELEGALAELQEALDEGGMLLAQLRDTVLTPLVEYGEVADRIKERLSAWLKAGIAINPGAYAVEELRERIRMEIRDAFAASPVAANLQAVHRAWIYAVDAAVREALDATFQALNDQIVAVAESVAEELQPVKSFSSVVQSLNWNGHAQIRGDRLSLLRIDNRVLVNLPTPAPGVQVPLEFVGYYEFRELTSDGPVGCLDGVPGRANEIILGASAGPASMIVGTEVSVEAKFTRAEDGTLLLLAGGVEMDPQGMPLPGLGLNEFSATLSIAPAAREFYLSAFAGGRFGFGSTEVNVAGGVLIGRTCTADALSWDPQALTYLGPIDPDHPFTGVFVFGEGTIPIASVGCLMHASVSAGIRGWVTDPDFDFEGLTVGGALEGGVSAEYLCLARIRGSATLAGEMGPQAFTYGGSVELEGRLGICPLCIEFGGDVSATYVQGHGWEVGD